MTDAHAVPFSSRTVIYPDLAGKVAVVTGGSRGIGAATVAILFLLGYLAYTGVQDSKSYYVTIAQLGIMGDIELALLAVRLNLL